MPVEIGFNVSSGVWHGKWSRSLNSGSRLVFTDCEGLELGRFVVKEQCAFTEVTGITGGGNVFLRAEFGDSSEESSVPDFPYAASIALDPTGIKPHQRDEHILLACMQT